MAHLHTFTFEIVSNMLWLRKTIYQRLMIFEVRSFKKNIMLTVISFIIQVKSIDLIFTRFYRIWNVCIVSQIIFLVICLWLFDIYSFEHDFYARVSHAFLLIHSLSIYNIKEQKKKYFFRTYWLCKIIISSRHKYLFTLSEKTSNQIWIFDNCNREFGKRYNTYHLYIIETYCFRKPNSICEKFWSSSSLCESIVR
jgi:hypothetical protein